MLARYGLNSGSTGNLRLIAIVLVLLVCLSTLPTYKNGGGGGDLPPSSETKKLLYLRYKLFLLLPFICFYEVRRISKQTRLILIFIKVSNQVFHFAYLVVIMPQLYHKYLKLEHSLRCFCYRSRNSGEDVNNIGI